MTRTLKQHAIELLARREHSRLELKRKLLQRAYPADEIEHVLASLIEQNLLSDERFTEMYIRSRANRGYGPARIILELNERGVSEEDIQQGMANCEINWQRNALEVRNKKYYGTIDADYQTIAKQKRFLNYRGFTQEHIQYVFCANVDER